MSEGYPCRLTADEMNRRQIALRAEADEWDELQRWEVEALRKDRERLIAAGLTPPSEDPE